MSRKKRRQIKKSKQKVNIKDISLRKATISSLESSDKKKLRVLILVIKKLRHKAEDINIDMIDADTYRAAYRLKKAQVFAILIRDIQYQVEKEVKAETDPKSVAPQEYHDFLDIFSKKNSDTLPPRQKYDHKIYLEDKWKPGYAPLYVSQRIRCH